MEVASLSELKRAAKEGVEEVVVTDPKLAGKVRTLEAVRRAANISVFVILALAIFVWVNPIGWVVLDSPSVRLVRQIALGIGIALLFLDYFLPVVRHYRVGALTQAGLQLVSRKRKQS